MAGTMRAERFYADTKSVVMRHDRDVPVQFAIDGKRLHDRVAICLEPAVEIVEFQSAEKTNNSIEHQ